MSALSGLTPALLVIGLAPLVWSAVIYGASRVRASRLPDDATEKQILTILIVPVLAGIAGIALAALVPIPAVSHLMPVLVLEEALMPEAPQAVVQAGGHASVASVDVLSFVPGGMAALYILVAIYKCLRLTMACWRLGRIVAAAERAEEGICVTPVVVSAFAWGRSTVVLPRRLLDALDKSQTDMLVRHERAHLRRGDTLYYLLLGLVDALLWFNPFVRRQTVRCRLAAELACDSDVTQDHPEMRQVYAASLLLALKHTAGNASSISTQTCAPAVISPSNSGEFQMRLTEIMRASGARRKRPLWLPLVAAALVLPLAGVQFAWSQGQAVPGQPSPDAAGQTGGLRNFPATGRLSSPFSVRVDPETGKPNFHPGVDIAMPAGTPVHAAAAGVVSFAGTRYGYNTVVEIDHGDGLKTRYAQLDSAAVKAGDQVTADQVIAASGDYGTGPHLHFEVWKENPLRAYGELAVAADAMTRSNDGALTATGDVILSVSGRSLTTDKISWPAVENMPESHRPVP